MWNKPGLSDTHLEQTLWKKGVVNNEPYFYNVVSYIWCWDQSNFFKLKKKKKSDEWFLGNKKGWVEE